MARILIVDDEVGTLDWMEVALAGAGYEVQVAPSAQRALSILDRWTPDLALVDLIMPEVDGWAFSKMIARYRVPVVFVTIAHGEGEAILRGITGFIRKPLSPGRLRAEVQRVLGARPGRPVILVVDDEPDVRVAFSSILASNAEVLEAANGAEALRILDEKPVSLVISDVRMPVMDGRELVRRIRQDPRFVHLPVLVQTGDREAARLPIWTELQVEQVMTKDAFADWLLGRIADRLGEVHAGARP